MTLFPRPTYVVLVLVLMFDLGIWLLLASGNCFLLFVVYLVQFCCLFFVVCLLAVVCCCACGARASILASRFLRWEGLQELPFLSLTAAAASAVVVVVVVVAVVVVDVFDDVFC